MKPLSHYRALSALFRARPERGWNIDLFPSYTYYLLCFRLQPDVLCDVGSKDGRASIRFRWCAPRAEIFAFEADPTNYQWMLGDPALARHRVHVEWLAIREAVGSATLYTLRNEGPKDWRSSAASLRPRLDSREAIEIDVPATTLDDYFATRDLAALRFGLWIDVEGNAFEVLSGARSVLQRTDFLQVEVERRPHWAGQHMSSDVERFLHSRGFGLLVRPATTGQHDQLWVRNELLERHRSGLRAVVSAAYTASHLSGRIAQLRARFHGRRRG